MKWLGLFYAFVLGFTGGNLFATTDFHKLFTKSEFKAGDCVALTLDAPLEKWESPQREVIEKILEVGKEKYKTVWQLTSIPSIPLSLHEIKKSSQNVFEVVECTQLLREYKE